MKKYQKYDLKLTMIKHIYHGRMGKASLKNYSTKNNGPKDKKKKRLHIKILYNHPLPFQTIL